MNDVDKLSLTADADVGTHKFCESDSQQIDDVLINGAPEENATDLTIYPSASSSGTMTEIVLNHSESEVETPVNQNSDNPVLNDLPINNDDELILAIPEEDSSSHSSPHSIEKSQTCYINDLESKYLEEQANLKHTIKDSELQCAKLTATVSERDTTIESLRQERLLLEKEKQMMKKELDLAMKEKENAVMRYVTVERSVLEARSSQDVSDKKTKVMQKEVEVLNSKIKMITAEKTRICGLLDIKTHELKNCQRECDKLKNDVSSLETKTKWGQHKLKQEMDLKVAAEAKIEELVNDLKRVRDSEMTKLREEFNVDKMLNLERQCVEYQATQILLKHDIEEKDKKIEHLEQNAATVQTQYNELKSYHHNLIVENSSNKRELDRRNDEILEVQTILDKEVLKIADLQSKLNDLETLRTQLALEREANAQLMKELADLKETCDDQAGELVKLRDKETELLQFNKDLTERCVHLQSECTLLNAKVTAVQLENETIKKDKQYYDDIIGDLERRLAQEAAEKTEERIIAAKHIAEKTKLCDSLQKQVENGVSDLEAMKKKHSQTVKELTREIHNFMKKNQASQPAVSGAESQKPPNEAIPVENNARDTPQASATSSAHTSDSESHNGHAIMSGQLTMQPSQKTLIDRIVRLQHASARQAEKIDFLENHSANLVAELQKKAKLLHHYMLREQTGALASSKSDRNKAELSKHGGIMAAVYGGGRTTTPEITLDLSLEINKKLQAVLEDTLLKNITLKENLDTLGLEVDKLTRQLSSKAAPH